MSAPDDGNIRHMIEIPGPNPEDPVLTIERCVDYPNKVELSVGGETVVIDADVVKWGLNAMVTTSYPW
jgi:hypothetical protein